MNDMETQFLDLINKLIETQNKQHEEVKAQNEKVSDSLNRLRENVHDIKNEYHGQAELVKIIYRDVEIMKDQQDRDTGALHERINKYDDKFEVAIDKINKELGVVAPIARDLGKMKDHATKVVIGLVTTGALVAGVLQMLGKLE